MADKHTPVSKAAETISPDRIKGSAPMRKMREAPTPKEALKGPAMKALKLPGVRKVLQGLAFVRLVKVLRAIARLVGARALPVIALILVGWIFRRFRRRR